MHTRLLVSIVVIAVTGHAAGGLPELTPPATKRSAAQDAAVVIGVEGYSTGLPPATYAERDAEAFAGFLRDTVGIPRSRVKVLIGPRATGPAMERALKAYAAKVGAEGTLWVYFSGHGAPAKGDAWLMGYSVNPEPDYLAEGSLRRSRLVQLAGAIPADARAVVVLDACFSGQDRSGKGLSKLRFSVPSTLAAAPRVAVWSATQANEFAGPLAPVRHGLFTYFVVGALSGWADRDGDGRVSFREAERYVSTSMGTALERAGRSQRPKLTAHDATDGWMLAVPGRLAQRPPKLDALRDDDGGGFRPEALPAVPDVVAPSRLEAARGMGGQLPSAADIDALEAYEAVAKFDASDAEVADKVKRWRALAKGHPRYAKQATARATTWERYVAQRAARRAWEAQRKAAMARDWGRLGRVIGLSVVPDADKRRWAASFVAAYGSTRAENPHLAALRPYLAASSGVEWVRIPGGSFRMGSTKQSDEQPVHTVRVKTFELAKSEVTVAQYAACVEAGGCTEPETGGSCNWKQAGREDHPVNCVDWSQARAFSKWAGGRLPTEAEWEYAARSGGKDQRYPWGNDEASCSRAVMDDGGNGCGREATWPVCKKSSGNSAQGVCDLAGNVWEWVEDVYADSYRDAPTDGSARTSGGSLRVFRGGGWFDSAGFLRAAYRIGNAPSDRGDYIGFRPARSSH